MIFCKKEKQMTYKLLFLYFTSNCFSRREICLFKELIFFNRIDFLSFSFLSWDFSSLSSFWPMTKKKSPLMIPKLCQKHTQFGQSINQSVSTITSLRHLESWSLTLQCTLRNQGDIDWFWNIDTVRAEKTVLVREGSIISLQSVVWGLELNKCPF